MLAGGLGEALHKVEVRLTSIDGQIQRVGEIAEASATHIDEHDRQTEPWKRRIERVEHDVEILKNGKNNA
jgi:archaellum component FlaC